MPETDTKNHIPSTAPEKFLKPYNASEVENKIYKLWEDSGFFNPDVCIEKGITKPDAPHFSMVLPPPNVTGRLHLGHALEHSLQDAVVRFARMRGKRTTWIPGTDHAAIATQSRFEKDFQKETGKSRHDFSRDEFFGMINEFGLRNQNDMLGQMRLLGSSLDWSREAFTLDEQRSLSVRTAFKKMYDEGLIYRGYRVVNWDPKGQTTIADDEIVHEERDAKMYTFKYSKDFPISISTTRPETKVGDVAVAVHPEDTRYAQFVGKEYNAVFCSVPIHIKIIADTAVEKEFGTGALGVTPAHSQTDAEIAERHKLPMVQVINEYAKMSVGDERILGKKTTEAREVIVQWLRDEGLLEKEESIKQNVGTAERTGGIVEPLPKLQWFIDVNKPIPSKDGKTLKDLMREPIESGKIKVLPDHFEKIYYNWVNNLRDWCISRQIIYGHQIPVWYDKENNIHLPKEIKVYLARHGQSEFNLSKTFTTQEDADNTPLTEQGIEDARTLAQSLKGKKITKIISSNLFRTKQTAEIVAKELGQSVEEIEIWEDLQEVRIGDNNGMEKPKGYNPLKFSIENNIQTLEAIEKQGNKVLEKIKSLSDGEQVLIVGHGAINSVFIAIDKGVPKEKFIEHRNKLGLQKNGGYFEMNFIVQPDGENLTQDPDTLDTWFSSGLWTFSTLGWPHSAETATRGTAGQQNDFKNYHPTTFMNPGYEILFFWVARMVMMSEYLLGVIPFETVYLHGIVRDSHGKKFSKSAKNGVEPEEIIKQYGTDALRMSMVVGIGPGNDLNFDVQKVKAYSKFANKIWNATRFVLEQVTSEKLQVASSDQITNTKDKEYIAELNNLVQEVTKEMEEYKLYLVSEKLYHYFWHTFADKIIEEIKVRINDANTREEDRQSGIATLLQLLTCNLKLLHPFMPFVTEEIWQSMPTTADKPDSNNKRLLMIEPWPH